MVQCRGTAMCPAMGLDVKAMAVQVREGSMKDSSTRVPYRFFDNMVHKVYNI